MGQKHWAIVCALVLTAATAGDGIAQQPADNPFGRADDGPSEPQQLGIEEQPRAERPASSYASHDAEQRIEATLNQELREPWDFVEQPLRDVVSIVSETYGIPIQFDTAALDAVAASPDVEVSIAINNVSLRSALDLMLSNAGAEALTYIVDNEVLLITTQEEAETRLEVKVYRVDDLTGDGVTASPYAADADTLINIIVASVEHDSWMENGTGEGEINFFPPGMIVISQTHRVQEQVEQLLDDLRRNKAAVVAASAESQAETAQQPVSRSLPLSVHVLTAEGAADKIREALLSSVDWDSAATELPNDEKFLTVLQNQVLVRHLPHVVAQVEKSMKDLNLSPSRPSRSRGGGMGGMGGRGGGFRVGEGMF